MFLKFRRKPSAPRCQETISAFPDPSLSKVDSVLHYHDGEDPKEKILQIVLDHVKKSAHGILFNPTAKTAKNMGFAVRCEE